MSFIIIIIFFYLAFNLNLIREEIEIAFKIFYSDTRWTRFLSPREIAKDGRGRNDRGKFANFSRGKGTVSRHKIGINLWKSRLRGYSRPRRLRRRLIGASRGRVTTGCHDKRLYHSAT